MTYKTKTVNPVSGQRLRETLKKRGITHEKLAEYIGVTPDYVGHMCQGKRAIPEKRAREIGNLLGVRPEYLLGLDDYPTPNKEWLKKTTSAVIKKWEYFDQSLRLWGYEIVNTNPYYEEAGDQDPDDRQEDAIEETITGMIYTIRKPSGDVVEISGDRLETLVDDIARSARRYIKEALNPED